MKNRKAIYRILSVVLVLCLVIGMIPMTARDKGTVLLS